jgi:hypothetical protein
VTRKVADGASRRTPGKSEIMEFYRRMNPKPGTPMIIYRGAQIAADKQNLEQPPPQEENGL